MISLDIHRRVEAGTRAFDLDVSLSSQARRIALFGPSGAGKSLTIRAIAGLLRLDRGCIVVNGVTLYDSDRGIALSPQARRLGYLQQDYGLFPHLTVIQNIAFGLTRGWLNPRGRRLPEVARRWVDAFDLDAILNSYPSEISGGQKQRVALARALSVEPRLLLLDEPLAALDAGLRVRMREELAALQSRLDIPTILITHDPQDAVMLADQVFRIRDGRIEGDCTPQGLMAAQNATISPSGQSMTPSMTLDALKIA
ncbi:ATP-binding cassette domain-containing protein [Allopusillimonas soli]|uniref:ATP-binding cassette domain-containing protein n=1 Tax=Allopusillimonas soli TaxID=659016 RepID=A0A853FFW8_9BURK|nr:ATP-binding cassette domain-containing protein [Allopusillimonas soli]NYT38558.1 ATP-binding cassette domain-containing protein [Allopusillimonas soli]TEA71727.1 ATP-binding cassette domain-containing protein [Allopusillimonas soli]